MELNNSQPSGPYTPMRCPLCATELKMTERVGIEIDYCPQCRGVWLDRGELDKIIERSKQTDHSGAFPGAPSEETAQERHRPIDATEISSRHPRHDEHDDYRPHDEYRKSRHQKKRGFLGELFDF